MGTLIDDTLGFWTKKFSEEEEIKSKSQRSANEIGGIIIRELDEGYRLHQQQYAKSLKKIDSNNFTANGFSHLREQVSFIAHGTILDILYFVSKLAQIKTNETEAKNACTLNGILSTLQLVEKGINLPKLEMDSFQISGYADAGFA